ncbi:thiolase domain-containing protein [Desulfurella sp.]|uniref:thiolase domain-containing protein n=1 Tax=Desulfurella sp. TaxID=1962857 RepID=UPI003D0C34D2
MREVAVVGIGMTNFGYLWEKSWRDLAVEASLEAIKSSGVDKIDSIYLGNFSGGTFVEQEHMAAILADYLGFLHLPSTRIENACASGGVAIRHAYMEVASGMSDTVLVTGVEKMTDVVTSQGVYSLSMAADREYEGYQGVTFPGLFALVAKKYMHDFNATRKQLAAVAVKNHKNASKNPKAQFHNIITIDDVLNASIIADPLGLYDCSPMTDGAASVILMPLEKAKKLSNAAKPIKISGIAQATDTIALAQRDDFVTFQATIEAAKKAYQMAGKSPNDINVAEVHDCFTIAEVCAIEDLGFFEKGKGAKATEDGLTEIGGKIPVNPSGGLKGKGHPVGATGVAQIVNLVEQLRGQGKDLQVNNAKVGLAHNLGGSGATVTVTILEVI